jgi:hypothetical protein
VELFVAHADKPSSRVEIRFDRMLLTVLGEIVGQCLFTEIIQVTVLSRVTVRI